jgi:hypothetical protein
MSSALRTRALCGRRGQVRRPSPPADEPPAGELFGVVILDGRQRRARSVVLAFDNAEAATAYAVDNQLVDYFVAPLSFLAPAGVPTLT